jgi:hypothetical protein
MIGPMITLILKRDPVGQNPDDYSVIENGVIVAQWLSRLAVKVSPRKGPGPNVRSSSLRKSYSSFADQFPAIAHSTPAPTTQPLFRLDALIEAPVVRFVMVALLSTHPPPALP